MKSAWLCACSLIGLYVVLFGHMEQAASKGTMTNATVVECGGSYADDPATTEDESKFYDCLVELYKNCLLNTSPAGLAAEEAFKARCIYVRTKAQIKADHPGGGGWNAYQFKGEVVHKLPTKSIGATAADRDWWKKMVIYHESAHLHQSQTNAYRNLWYAKKPDGTSWPRSADARAVFLEAWKAYVEIEATMISITHLQSIYDSLPNGDPAKPSAKTHAARLLDQLIYMRRSVVRLCLPATWNPINALGADHPWYETFKGCKDWAKDLYPHFTADIKALDPTAEVPAWP